MLFPPHGTTKWYVLTYFVTQLESEQVLLLNHDCNIAPLIVFWQDDPAKIGLPMEGSSDVNVSMDSAATSEGKYFISQYSYIYFIIVKNVNIEANSMK